MYELGKYFTVRTASAPIIVEKQYMDQDFMKRILLVSEELYHGIKKQGLNEKNKLSLEKYRLRSFSRATPLGAFSSVSFHDFSERVTNSIIRERDVELKVVPDAQWLFELTKKIEGKIYRDLTYMWNKDLKFFDFKIVNFWGTGKDIGLNIHNNTRALQIFRRLLGNKEMNFHEIKTSFLSSYGEIDTITFENFFLELVANDIILSSLNTTIYLQDLNLLVQQIEETGNLNEKFFYEIRTLNNEFQGVLKLSNITEEDILSLLKRMRNIQESEKYLKVDSITKYSKFALSKIDINEELSPVINVLNFYCTRLHDNSLNRITNLFLERYGYSSISFKKFWEENIDTFYSKKIDGDPYGNSRKVIEENLLGNYFEHEYEYIDLAEIMNLISEIPEISEKPSDFQIVDNIYFTNFSYNFQYADKKCK